MAWPAAHFSEQIGGVAELSKPVRRPGPEPPFEAVKSETGVCRSPLVWERRSRRGNPPRTAPRAAGGPAVAAIRRLRVLPDPGLAAGRRDRDPRGNLASKLSVSFRFLLQTREELKVSIARSTSRHSKKIAAFRNIHEHLRIASLMHNESKPGPSLPA